MQQSYLFYYVAIALILIIIVAVIYASFRIRKQKLRNRFEANEYIRALNYLIEGNYSLAVEYFYKAVQKDTENIDAYLKLGDIFRHQKKVEKAIKIHNELLVRRNLDHLTKTEIIRSLTLDYFAAEKYDKALESINSLFAVEPKNVWAKKQQVAIFEAKQDWESAFKALKLLDKWEKQEAVQNQLSLYKVEQAKQKFREKKEKEGRILLREAIKIEANCSAAYIALGDSYVRAERFTDAIKTWVEFVRKVPHQSYLVFDRLQEVLYSMGSYSEIENILQELYQENSKNLDIVFTLADIRARKGELDTAIGLCKSALEIDPGSIQAKLRLVKLYDRKEDKEKALKVAVELAEQSAEVRHDFHCSVCNYHTDEVLWHCPNCGAWNSFDI